MKKTQVALIFIFIYFIHERRKGDEWIELWRQWNNWNDCDICSFDVISMTVTDVDCHVLGLLIHV